MEPDHLEWDLAWDILNLEVDHVGLEDRRVEEELVGAEDKKVELEPEHKTEQPVEPERKLVVRLERILQKVEHRKMLQEEEVLVRRREPELGRS